jgi:hypothetical protein
MEAALYAQTAINFSMPAKRLLESCEYREVPVDWEYGGYAFKGVIDASSQHTIVDLKSMRDAEPKAVHKKILDMGYHIQAALYREAMGYLPSISLPLTVTVVLAPMSCMTTLLSTDWREWITCSKG